MRDVAQRYVTALFSQPARDLPGEPASIAGGGMVIDEDSVTHNGSLCINCMNWKFITNNLFNITLESCNAIIYRIFQFNSL